MYQFAPRSRVRNREEFESLMAFAQEVANDNPAALPDVVRLFLRPFQAEALIDVAAKGERYDVPRMDDREFFWPKQFDLFGSLYRTKRKASDYRVSLSREIVLPSPWHPKRMSKALSQIGKGKTLGRWKQDDFNHLVHVWLPWGIAFVGNGNHSISAGIIGSEGVLTPTEVDDMSAIFRYVICDGDNFIERKTRRVLGPAHDPRIAATFEVGRLMRRHGVSAEPQLLSKLGFAR